MNSAQKSRKHIIPTFDYLGAFFKSTQNAVRCNLSILDVAAYLAQYSGALYEISPDILKNSATENRAFRKFGVAVTYVLVSAFKS